MAMTTRLCRWLMAGTMVLLVSAAPAGAASPDVTTLTRVVLLPATDRSSIVFEFTAEPQQLTTRRISDSIVEFEAGPGIESNVAPVLKAPAHVRFVDSVIVRTVDSAGGPMLRARIALTTAAQAVVRTSGRRVYVDVSALPAAPDRPAPNLRTRPATVRTAPPAAVSAEEAYRTAIGPAIARLRELGPFLTSAAAGTDASVAAALQPTLASLRATLAGLEPPGKARGSHTMVLTAVDRIAAALAADFTGDRATVVRQSVTTIDVVGGVLVTPSGP